MKTKIVRLPNSTRSKPGELVAFRDADTGETRVYTPRPEWLEPIGDPTGRPSYYTLSVFTDSGSGGVKEDWYWFNTYDQTARWLIDRGAAILTDDGYVVPMNGKGKP